MRRWSLFSHDDDGVTRNGATMTDWDRKNVAFEMRSELARSQPGQSGSKFLRPERLGPGDEDQDNDDGGMGGPGTGVVTKTRTKTKKPSMYKVLMLNDDYTPMEFVIYVLERFFGKSREEATQVMLHVHNRGVGICGVFTYEVAETKATQVMDAARKEGHPLQCTLEKE